MHVGVNETMDIYFIFSYIEKYWNIEMWESGGNYKNVRYINIFSLLYKLWNFFIPLNIIN